VAIVKGTIVEEREDKVIVQDQNGELCSMKKSKVIVRTDKTVEFDEIDVEYGNDWRFSSPDHYEDQGERR
jgi:murein tripeptide amidase MpaA